MQQGLKLIWISYWQGEVYQQVEDILQETPVHALEDLDLEAVNVVMWDENSDNVEVETYTSRSRCTGSGSVLREASRDSVSSHNSLENHTKHMVPGKNIAPKASIEYVAFHKQPLSMSVVDNSLMNVTPKQQ